MNPEKLVCFLYLLMRDVLPCGEVARLMQEVGKANEFDLTNKYLESYARETAGLLLNGDLTCEIHMCNTPKDQVQVVRYQVGESGAKQGPLCADCRRRYAV